MDDEQADALLAKAEKRWPRDVFTNVSLSEARLSRGDRDGATRYARRVLELDPRNDFALLLVSTVDVERGDYQAARSRYAAAYPELLAAEPPKLDGQTYGAASDLASILEKTGERERAELLFDRSEQYLRALPRPPRDDGLAMVGLHLARGQKKEALAAFREAVKAGWNRAHWRTYRYDPLFAQIRDKPEVKAVYAGIERDMARQRALLAARPKDAPLIPPPSR